MHPNTDNRRFYLLAKAGNQWLFTIEKDIKTLDKLYLEIINESEVSNAI